MQLCSGPKTTFIYITYGTIMVYSCIETLQKMVLAVIMCSPCRSLIYDSNRKI